MKIYTGTGDTGKTSLFSGERITKNNPIVEAYGDLDELNAIIGALISVLPGTESTLLMELKQIQCRLLQAGAWLATSPDSPMVADLVDLTPAHIRMLEESIDRIDTQLAPLSDFILPGGHPSAAWSHIARTVCRRVERKIVGLLENYRAAVPPSLKHTLIYINRLSDYLFVLSRLCNRIHGVSDVPWEKSHP